MRSDHTPMVWTGATREMQQKATAAKVLFGKNTMPLSNLDSGFFIA